MADEQNNEAVHDQNSDAHNRPMDYEPVRDEAQEKVDENEGEMTAEDHIARIRELAMQLPETSPSGATTISQKILFHLDAHANPDEFNKKVADDRERMEEEERIRAERRADTKKPVEDKQEA